MQQAALDLPTTNAVVRLQDGGTVERNGLSRVLTFTEQAFIDTRVSEAMPIDQSTTALSVPDLAAAPGPESYVIVSLGPTLIGWRLVSRASSVAR